MRSCRRWESRSPTNWEIAFIAITPRNLREDTQSVSDEVRAAYKRVVGMEAPLGVVELRGKRGGNRTDNGKPDVRLHRGGRGFGRIGARQPAERQPEAQGAGAGSRARKPSVVAYPGRLCQADQQPRRQLAVFVGARRGHRPAPHSHSARQAAGRFVFDQRHGVRARPVAGL